MTDTPQDSQDWMRELGAIRPTRAAREAAREEGASATPEARYQHRIARGAYDDRMYAHARELPQYNNAITWGESAWTETEALAQDVLAAFFKQDPQTQPVTAHFQDNASAIDALLADPEYQRLHASCAFDELKSSLAAASFVEKMTRSLGEARAERNRARREAQERASEEGEGEEPQDPQAEAREEREAQAATRQAVRAALAAAEKEVERQEAAEALLIGAGWGSDDGASQHSGNIAQRAALARKLSSNSRLARVLELAGRLRFIARAQQAKKVKGMAGEAYDVTRGNDLARVLPSEMAMRGNPRMRKLFTMNYLSESLLQSDTRGPAPKGKGPIICCVDESGSMKGYNSEWAAAVALCLLMIARQQKRDFRLVHFGSAYQILVQDFPKGRGDEASLLLAGEHFFDGGTDFEAPLGKALESVEASAYRKADVIFITDGVAQISEEFGERWAKARKLKGMRCHGLLVGTARDYPNVERAGYGLGVLRAFCDDAERLSEPGGPEDAPALAASFGI